MNWKLQSTGGTEDRGKDKLILVTSLIKQLVFQLQTTISLMKIKHSLPTAGPGPSVQQQLSGPCRALVAGGVALDSAAPRCTAEIPISQPWGLWTAVTCELPGNAH